MTSLAAALTPSGAMQATLDGLRADPRTLHLALVQLVGADAPQDRIVVVVDQLEEVFTLCDDDAIHRRDQAVAGLSSCCIICVRSKASFRTRSS